MCRYNFTGKMAGYTGRNILIVVDNSAVRYQSSRKGKWGLGAAVRHFLSSLQRL